ncbi:MAG: SpaA isopeptide-forming pilin-related protein, partial [Firmicutes bacterium]|nr:SpaA isopeptide-forming pilin-related protein [Bacillota bacterium]
MRMRFNGRRPAAFLLMAMLIVTMFAPAGIGAGSGLTDMAYAATADTTHPDSAETGWVAVTICDKDGNPFQLKPGNDDCHFWVVDTVAEAAGSVLPKNGKDLYLSTYGIIQNPGPSTSAVNVTVGTHYIAVITAPSGHRLPKEVCIPVTVGIENTADNPAIAIVRYPDLAVSPDNPSEGPGKTATADTVKDGPTVGGGLIMPLATITGDAGAIIGYLADGTPVWQHVITMDGTSYTTFCSDHGNHNPTGVTFTENGPAPEGKILSVLCYLYSDYVKLQGAYWMAIGQYATSKDATCAAMLQAAKDWIASHPEGSHTTPAEPAPTFSWADQQTVVPNGVVTISGTPYLKYGPFTISGATAGIWAETVPSGWKVGNNAGTFFETAKSNTNMDAAFYVYVPTGSASGVAMSFTGGYSGETTSSLTIGTGTEWKGTNNFQTLVYNGGGIYSTSTEALTVSQQITFLTLFNVALKKYDAGTGGAAQGAGTLGGAVYSLYSAADNSLVQQGTTDSGGKISFKDIIWGKYYIKENTPSYGYELNPGTIQIDPDTMADTNLDINVSSPEVIKRFNINFQKKDSVTGMAAQGDATLAGALYGLYCAASNNTYTANQLVMSARTDESGKITFSNILWGQYYIKEITPSEGYLLSTAAISINPDTIAGQPNGTATIYVKDVTATEQVKKQKFELIKVGTSGDGTETTLLNAGFKVYLISELSKVKNGSLKPASGDWSYKDFKGYNFSSEKTAMIDGVQTPEFFSDSLGHFVSPEFPYGKYIVVESKTPAGYLAINPFIVTVTDDSRTAQPWRIFDDKEMSFYIRVIKKDADTGNTVLNKTAKYRIFDLDANAYIKMKLTYPAVVWYGTEDNPFSTDGTGMLITPEKLKYGHYRLDEVTAPEGYVLAGYEQTAQSGYDPDGHVTPNPADPVYIELGGGTPVYLPDAEDDVLEVVQFNEQQKGNISLEKKGERPQSVTVDKNGNMVFAYENEPLARVVFDVIADGDIVSQDGSGTVVYKDGEVVAEITTDEDGHAWADDLLIGNYILREVGAPDGYLFVDDEHFCISKLAQTEQYSFITWDLTDARQKLGLEIKKAEEGSGFPLEGAEFSLYAAENMLFGNPADNDERFFSGILSTVAGGEPFNLIEKDAFIAKAVAGKDGKAVFSDLPPGKYYAKETFAPAGYKINKDWQPEFTLAYNGHEAL